jgi:hypothetical protein
LTGGENETKIESVPSPPRAGAARTGGARTGADRAGEPDARADRARIDRARTLSRLLDDLGADLRRGAPPSATTAPRPTGLAEVDRILGGGLPPGRLCEITGPATSGRTSLAHALLAVTTAAGHLAAWIDLGDGFDPASAAAAGVDLERVLWIRPPDPAAALRSAERVLLTRGFAVLVVDRTGADAAAAERSRAAWTRLRRLVAGTDVVLLVLGSRRIVGADADLAVEMEAPRAHFGAAPDWLEALEARVRLVRNRAGPAERVAAVRLRGAA